MAGCGSNLGETGTALTILDGNWSCFQRIVGKQWLEVVEGGEGVPVVRRSGDLGGGQWKY